MSPRSGHRAPSSTARIARTCYATTRQATQALGTSSLSMVLMLLDLCVAHEEGRSVSVSSLCIASGAAQTTALRQIGQLEKRGFILRRGDETDRRRCWVTPTPLALDLIESLAGEWNAVV